LDLARDGSQPGSPPVKVRKTAEGRSSASKGGPPGPLRKKEKSKDAEFKGKKGSKENDDKKGNKKANKNGTDKKHKQSEKTDETERAAKKKEKDDTSLMKLKKRPAAAFVKKLLAQSSKDCRASGRAPGKESQQIVVGSDCSGYGSEVLALTLCSVEFKLAFCAELDPVKVKMLEAVHEFCKVECPTMYKDIKMRDNKAARRVQLFVSGAPCPAWSSAGLRAGLDDLKDRGVTIFYSLDYVRGQRPTVVVFENVQGLSFKTNAHILDTIKEILGNLGYQVFAKVMNTADHGIPHNRPRLYIVALRRTRIKHAFTFPEKIKQWPINLFLNEQHVGKESDLAPCAEGLSIQKSWLVNQAART